MIAKNMVNTYGLWGMGYGYKITANQLGKSKYVCPIREYGLYLVCVRRESTVVLPSHLTHLALLSPSQSQVQAGMITLGIEFPNTVNDWMIGHHGRCLNSQ